MVRPYRDRAGLFERRFTVDGLTFNFEAAPGAAVVFYIVGGGTRKRRYNPHFWLDFQDVVSVEDGDYFRSALPVFKAARALLLEWAFRDRPYLFRIEASTDRKEPIYRWMAHRLAKRLYGQYSMIEEHETFFFYRNHSFGADLS
ncbi:hypothetical protein [Kaistia nematophila]|uniref:Uncharacterized protein n=1 Tax=Kaistia nematophila TaxID=2994654 RepID=A0A9X3INU2_9HYPH|nr:hypothetical protein [Kaistia nematophila]MCX5572312.1 hypothetical protein [Kaistia nematophila]